MKEILGIGTLCVGLVGGTLALNRSYNRAQYDEATRQAQAVPALLQADKLYDAQQALEAAQKYLTQTEASRERGDGPLFIYAQDVATLESKIAEVRPLLDVAQEREWAYNRAVEADIARIQATVRKTQQPRLGLVRSTEDPAYKRHPETVHTNTTNPQFPKRYIAPSSR